MDAGHDRSRETAALCSPIVMRLGAAASPVLAGTLRYLFSHAVPKENCQAGHYLAWVWNELVPPGTKPNSDLVVKGMAIWLLAQRASLG